jgi:hypothetical protein
MGTPSTEANPDGCAVVVTEIALGGAALPRRCIVRDQEICKDFGSAGSRSRGRTDAGQLIQSGWFDEEKATDHAQKSVFDYQRSFRWRFLSQSYLC